MKNYINMFSKRQMLKNNVYLLPSLRRWRTTVASLSTTTSGLSRRIGHVLLLQTSAQCRSQPRPGASVSVLSPCSARRHQHICLWDTQVHAHCRTCWHAQKLNKLPTNDAIQGVLSFLVGGPAPVLEKLVPAGDGGQISVCWSWQPGRKLLRHYVIEWADERAVELQWQIVEKSRNSTVITGEKTVWLLSSYSSRMCCKMNWFLDFTWSQLILDSFKCSQISLIIWMMILYLCVRIHALIKLRNNLIKLRRSRSG